MLKEEGKYIYLVKDEPNYYDGWYFSDEAEQLNGPFSTKEQCELILREYCNELNKAASRGNMIDD